MQDDTLIVMEASAPQLFFLKGVLQAFSDSTGLRINFSKSMMVPINLSNEKLLHLPRTFGCQTGTFPFKYLGFPLGLTRPRVDDFLPFISKCKRRLSYIFPFAQSSWQTRTHKLSSFSPSNLHYVFNCSTQIGFKANRQAQKTLPMERG